MLDSRIQEWLTRIPRNGPWLVSLALAALIAVELARVAIVLLGGSPVKSVQPVATRAAVTPQFPVIDVQRVAAAHLFGIATTGPGNQDPANAPPTTANLVLTGTIATQDPKRGVAIISDGGPSKVYSVGDNVSGAALHSVYLDRVILNRGGNLETLVLPRLLPPARPAIVRSTAGQNPRTTASVENIRRMVQQDPGILTQIMRTVASYDNNAGKLRGFRIYPGRNRSAFNGLGLRPGDLVTAINGTPLDDPQRGQEIMNTIESSDSATVTIERGGQTQNITLNIAQVATAATKDLTTPPEAAAPQTGGADGAAGASAPPAVPGLAQPSPPGPASPSAPGPAGPAGATPTPPMDN